MAIAVAAAVFCVAAAFSTAMPIPAELRPRAKGYNAVPGNKLAHADCVHRVANGAFAWKDATTGRWNVEANGATHELPKCVHPLIRRRAPQHGPAWIVDAMQDDAAGNGFSFFGTNFTVPTDPATLPGDVLLYYWPGLEDEAEGDVIQPVLQFGVGPYGGGNYWLYQSWFVSGDGTVLVGDQAGPIASGLPVYGSIEAAADGSSYTSTAVAPAGTPNAPSVLTVATSEAQLQTRAYVTVEIYGIGSDCSVTPPDNALAFTNIELRDGAGHSVKPGFTAETQHEVCDHRIVLGSDTVTITWRS